jgi:hypothetical protein
MSDEYEHQETEAQPNEASPEAGGDGLDAAIENLEQHDNSALDDLESHLAEFAEATREEPPTETGDEYSSEPGYENASLDQDLAEIIGEQPDPTFNSYDNGAVEQLQHQVGALTNAVQQMHQQNLQNEDNAEIDKLIGKIGAELKKDGYHIDEKTLRASLYGEALADGKLAFAFDNRRTDAREFESRFEKAKSGIVADLKGQIEAAAEKQSRDMVVAWAMRQNSTQVPTEPPPRYGQMTDAEFEAEKQKFNV